MDLIEIRKYAQKCYDDANCKYNGQNYFAHITMVVSILEVNIGVFKNDDDKQITIGAAFCHDLIEDAQQTYNDIMSVAGKDVADITLAVTDVHAENRLMRHLLTMHKTVKDYRAIILKLCDIYANASYSKSVGSSMYRKYVNEYPYRKAIFTNALKWYEENLNQKELDEIWKGLDEIHNNL